MSKHKLLLLFPAVLAFSAWGFSNFLFCPPLSSQGPNLAAFFFRREAEFWRGRPSPNRIRDFIKSSGRKTVFYSGKHAVPSSCASNIKKEKRKEKKPPVPDQASTEEEEEINGTLNPFKLERKTRAAALFSLEMQQIQMKARIWGVSPRWRRHTWTGI